MFFVTITERSVSNCNQMKNMSTSFPVKSSHKFSKGALAILSVAESLFAQKGFKATSISEIAKKTGGSKANIYHHFKSKEHLYQETLELACEHVFDVLQPSKGQLSSDPKQRLKEYITLHLKSMIEQPNSTNLIKRELMDNNQIEGRLLAKDIFTTIFKKVAALVFDTHEIEKESHNISATLQAFMLIGVNMFFFDSQSVMKYLPDMSSLSDSPEAFSNMIFDLIINQSSISDVDLTEENSNA